MKKLSWLGNFSVLFCCVNWALSRKYHFIVTDFCLEKIYIYSPSWKFGWSWIQGDFRFLLDYFIFLAWFLSMNQCQTSSLPNDSIPKYGNDHQFIIFSVLKTLFFQEISINEHYYSSNKVFGCWGHWPIARLRNLKFQFFLNKDT